MQKLTQAIPPPLPSTPPIPPLPLCSELPASAAASALLPNSLTVAVHNIDIYIYNLYIYKTQTEGQGGLLRGGSPGVPVPGEPRCAHLPSRTTTRSGHTGIWGRGGATGGGMWFFSVVFVLLLYIFFRVFFFFCLFFWGGGWFEMSLLQSFQQVLSLENKNNQIKIK